AASSMSFCFSTGSVLICDRTIRLVMRCSRATSVIAVLARLCCWARSPTARARYSRALTTAVMALVMGGSVLVVIGRVASRSTGGPGRRLGRGPGMTEQTAVAGLQGRLGLLQRVGPRAGVLRVHPAPEVVLGDGQLGLGHQLAVPVLLVLVRAVPQGVRTRDGHQVGDELLVAHRRARG